jgi:hypothetical protein
VDIRAPDRRPEQTRARYPDEAAHVERDGVKIFYEVYGAGEQTVLLMPTWDRSLAVLEVPNPLPG